ncbi:hypothetical protein [Massilia sp. DWR3-1-1]|uniref:hypothetical protein n=1 Tax=Massilia sp. DWR3-1-1 TaxID=2804559 RepID=UPI003CE96E68
MSDLPVSLSKDQPVKDSGGAQPGAAAPVGVRAVVASHVERLTRFDDADLGERQDEQQIAVKLALERHHGVSFAITRFRGKGRLPASATRLTSKAAMEATLDERLDEAGDEVGAAMARWAGADQRAYRRVMRSADAFLAAPCAAGYEHTCRGCRGARQLTCDNCRGRGKISCSPCAGTGKINCSNCGGSRKKSCSGCYGSGSVQESVSNQVWDSSTNSYHYVSGTRTVSCSGCSGSGYLSCYSCDYAGKVRCGACGGDGDIGCRPCGRTGKVDCGTCAATGIEHAGGIVAASVEAAESLAIAGANQRLSALVRQRIATAELPAYGALLGVTHQAGDSAVVSTYTMRLDVRHAAMRAREREFSLYGFGPACAVLDFCNIVGHMLEDDLQAFEADLLQARRWRLKRAGGDGVLAASARFLRSELNMEIVEHANGAAADAAAVEQRFSGLVDAAYIARVVAALGRATGHIYGDQMRAPALVLCGLVALAAAATAVAQWPDPRAPLSAAACMGAAAAAWLVLEWWQQRAIMRGFDGDIGARMLARIKADGSVRNWRIGMLLAAGVAAGLGQAGALKVPAVRALHAERAAVSGARADIDGWFGQSDPDYRQRVYPAQAGLRAQAQAGNAAAQTVLAWQLLLGAGGVPQDLAGAGALLDQLKAAGARGASLPVADAILVLQREATPAQQRDAAALLGQLAERLDFAEARYWQARSHIDPRSATFDSARAVKLLDRAARQGHAHAALLLGQVFAEGRAVRQDRRRARQLLQLAASRGLDEAREALGKLR